MDQIKISFGQYSGLCELLPQMDRETGILCISSNTVFDWPYGIDVDGMLIFDLDENRRLVNMDLHVPESLWERVEKLTLIDFDMLRSNNKPIDVFITEDSVASKSFELQMRIQLAGSKLLIVIGEKVDGIVSRRSLSSKCDILHSNDCLVGFQIKL